MAAAAAAGEVREASGGRRSTRRILEARGGSSTRRSIRPHSGYAPPSTAERLKMRDRSLIKTAIDAPPVDIATQTAKSATSSFEQHVPEARVAARAEESVALIANLTCNIDFRIRLFGPVSRRNEDYRTLRQVAHFFFNQKISCVIEEMTNFCFLSTKNRHAYYNCNFCLFLGRRPCQILARLWTLSS